MVILYGVLWWVAYDVSLFGMVWHGNVVLYGIAGGRVIFDVVMACGMVRCDMVC
jgi:hypothetical protein